MKVRSLGYRTDLMIRVTEGSQITDRGDHLVVRSPANPGFWWGNFLLLAGLKRGSGGAWLDRFAAEFPDADHVAIGLDVLSAADPAATCTNELTCLGLELDRTAVLTATAVNPPPHSNGDAVIRPLDGDDDWQQAAELRAAVSAGGPGDDLEFVRDRTAGERAAVEAGHGTWFGAFLGDMLAAQLGVFSDPADGLARYQNVETHPSVRRRGLAGTLVWHAGQSVLASGRANTLVIAADPGYHALRLYESVGFRVAEDQLSFQRQLDDPS